VFQSEIVDTEHFGAVAVHKRDCPLCGYDNQTVPASRYSHQSWAIKKCANCGFVYIDQRPASEIAIRHDGMGTNDQS
jgi:rubredoxin